MSLKPLVRVFPELFSVSKSKVFRLARVSLSRDSSSRQGTVSNQGTVAVQRDSRMTDIFTMQKVRATTVSDLSA